MREVLQTAKSAAPIGPYSQGIRAGGFIFVAGEKGVDVRTGQIVPGGVAAETRQTLENIKGILQAGGASLESVVATFVFMTDLSGFSAMNEVYAEYFLDQPPSRTTVEVTALPAGAQVEITAFALV